MNECWISAVNSKIIYGNGKLTMFFLQNKCSYNICNIHRKTPVLESLFNKVAALKACNFIKKRLHYKCFPKNIFMISFFIEHHWCRSSNCGYDLVVVHNERYERANISEIGKQLFPVITNQLGRKSDCAKKDCLLKRHPYFSEEDTFCEERHKRQDMCVCEGDMLVDISVFFE